MADESYFALASFKKAPELALALGDMILAWSRAESSLVGCIAAILNIEEHIASRLYANIPNFRSRVRTILALVHMHSDFAPIARPVLKLNALSKTRNGLVHGFYMRREDWQEFRLVDLEEPHESEKRSKPVKGPDIHHHAWAVRHRTKDLNEALDQVLTEKGVELELDLSSPD